MTIFGHDPGSKNYGIAVIRIESNRFPSKKDPVSGFGFSLLKVRKMKSCLTTLKDVKLARLELTAYTRELNALEEELDSDVHIAERYMSRRMGGSTIENVNMTLGVLRYHALQRGSGLRMIPASQWKNELKRRGILLDDWYKEAKTIGYSAHELDAVLIALYGACYVVGIKPYNFNAPEGFMRTVIRKMEKLKEAPA